MRELLETLIEKQEQLSEVDWKKIAASAALAGTLMATNPSDALAKGHSTKPSITQAETQIDVERLLNALREVESSGGRNNVPRYEPGVEKQLRNRYRRLAKHTQMAIDKYGYKAMATSYGPYQVLASTAYDIGYTGDLAALSKEDVSRSIAKKLVLKLMNSSRTNKVEDIVSAYNAGLGGIGNNPSYVGKVMRHYNG